MTPELWSISYSPWSDKARWALEHAGIEVVKRRYQPLLGEPAMRMRLASWRGRISVPVMLTDEGVMRDSFAIAEYASRHAPADRALVPASHRDAIARYDALSERGLAAGRVLGLGRTLASDDALRDLVPRPLARTLGRAAIAIAAMGVRRTLRKYASTVDGDARTILCEVLDQLRSELHGGEHLVGGTFTYADVVMAEVLAFIAPPATHLRLTEATRAAFRDAELAERYADLVAWRDELLRAHRGPDPRAAR